MASIATMTGADFDALPYEEGRHWELIEGELVGVSSSTPEHQILVQRILLALVLYFQSRGRALVLAGVEFALADNIRVRPDVCVLLGERARHLDKSKVPVQGCPDLAVEVISPSERTFDSMAKVELYLRHGVREVWQVYIPELGPRTRQVVLYTAEQRVSKLQEDAALSTELLPGFECAVASLFAE